MNYTDPTSAEAEYIEKVNDLFDRVARELVAPALLVLPNEIGNFTYPIVYLIGAIATATDNCPRCLGTAVADTLREMLAHDPDYEVELHPHH